MNFLGLLSVSETFLSTWEKFSGAVMSFNSFKDVLDILLVAVVVYSIILQIRKTQSVQVITGILFVALIFAAVYLFEMNASKFIFSNVIGDLLVILAVVFKYDACTRIQQCGSNTHRWNKPNNLTE
jgi:diadenylate cyclase